MIERGGGEDFLGVLEDAPDERRIAFLRNQVGWVVEGQLFDEEKVGGGNGVPQQLDAFADEWGYGEEFLRSGIDAGPFEEGVELAAELVDGECADVLGVEPDGFGIERIVVCEVNNGVGAIYVF